MRLIFLVFCSLLIKIESSKCPESRKPHSTSCTIFYSCVNLPDGGYVWVPSKCTEGLVFQPYLRMCVLPGDAWTCDTSVDSPFITNRYESPELIDPNETSYLGSTNDPLNFSELIDSSYTTDSIPNSVDQEMVTPYPVIEIEETMENKHDKNTDNTPGTNNVQYGYLQDQNDKKKQNSGNKYLMLNRLIHHLLVYKEITIPLEFLASSSLPMPPRTAINTNEVISNESEPSKLSQCSALQLQNTIVTDIKLQNASGSNTVLKEDDTSESASRVDASNSTPQTVLTDSENEHNIILITDTLGSRKYLNIDEYKSTAYNLDSQFVQLIPCVKNIRMPNTTDCVKYYTCEPEMATVIEYVCPSFTAFNKYTRMCDSELYRVCVANKSVKKNVKLSDGTIYMPHRDASEKNVCTELGKTKDPTSESRYYICYSSDNSKGIKSMRMTCPNSLIFCQSKKLCTTKRICKRT